MFKDEAVVGNFVCEMYCAKKSPFWLSPSYETNVIRVDPYWWAFNSGAPQDLYDNYWNKLLEIPGARLHWGKYQPEPGQKCGNVVYDVKYLKSVYPKLEEWLQLRAKYDPKNVFVTEYWQKMFEL